MSVRIHALAKEIKKTSKEVLEILVDRGYELKSASSTIDNITAESLVAEFKTDEVSEDSTESMVTSVTSDDSPQSVSSKSSNPSKIPLVKRTHSRMATSLCDQWHIALHVFDHFHLLHIIRSTQRGD